MKPTKLYHSSCRQSERSLSYDLIMSHDQKTFGTCVGVNTRSEKFLFLSQVKTGKNDNLNISIMPRINASYLYLRLMYIICTGLGLCMIVLHILCSSTLVAFKVLITVVEQAI